MGLWWAAVPKAYWPEDAESLKSIDTDWDPQVGDARQELVLIGIDMDETALRARLDACLLNDVEMAQGPQAWQRFADPFPVWDNDAQSAE
jgi:Cobalamin synthesis protein cobW C-terminal domain